MSTKEGDVLLELTPSEIASQESSWVEDFSDFSELSDKFLLSIRGVLELWGHNDIKTWPLPSGSLDLS